ncbi:MAG: T9SS type A sorting domain-containing protein [Bacteroidota bacterium]
MRRLTSHLVLTFTILYALSLGRTTPGYAQSGSDDSFEVVTWNIEWFGSTSRGPSNESLQLTNAARVIARLDADVYALQEITSQNVLNELVNASNSEIGVQEYYRGIIATHINQTQKLAYIYKPSVVSTIGAGAVRTFQDDFYWAGRLPFFLEIDATINGVTERLLLVNVHAKANVGSSSDLRSSYNRRLNAARDIKRFFDEREPETSIIFLGDYNDDVDQTICGACTSSASPYSDFVDDRSNYQILTEPLSIQNNLGSTVGRTSIIDHIMISNELFEFYNAGNTSVHLPGYISNYGNSTSDHYPVFARFDFGEPTSVEQTDAAPSTISLSQNYPNPFNPSTTIQFSVQQPQAITLAIFDVMGRPVQTLANQEFMGSGIHSRTFNASGLSSGLYFYRLTGNLGFSASGTMTLLK